MKGLKSTDQMTQMKRTDSIEDITIDRILRNQVTVIEGIAGSAKTSTTVKVLKEAGIPFLHTTSTNKLKKDIERRFGYQAKTTASALFSNKDLQFYTGEKEVNEDVIIIDEILQTDKNVFGWINDHKNKHIIICTDKKQMLSPFTGEKLIPELEKFEQNYDTINLEYSYRPVNSETRQLYDKFYNLSSDYLVRPSVVKSTFITEPFNETIEYNPDNVYLCHTNAIEKKLYKLWDLYNDYSNPNIIEKGSLSSKATKNISTNNPILPQIDSDTNKIMRYYQIGNVGSVVRYQGSEIEEGHTLYYFINPHSKITVREIYTMLTRAKNFHDIRIEVVPEEENTSEKKLLVSFNGLPIYSKRMMTIDTEETHIPSDKYQETLNEVKNTNYDDEVKNGYVYTGLVNKNQKVIVPQLPQTVKAGKGIWTLLKKEPMSSFSKTELLYSQIEYCNEKYGVGVENISGIGSLNLDTSENREKHAFEIDLYSAYPNVWYHCGILDGDTYRTEKGGSVELYLILSGCKMGRIISGDLLEFLNTHGESVKSHFLGSCDTLKSDTIGEKLYTMAYGTIESKQALKSMRYGYMQKPYFKHEALEHNTDVYIRQQTYKWEIQLAYIQSQMGLLISKVRYELYGNCHSGYAVVDALFFDNYNETTGENLKRLIAPYDFRITKNENKKTSDQEVLYKTYQDLKHRSHHKKK